LLDKIVAFIVVSPGNCKIAKSSEVVGFGFYRIEPSTSAGHARQALESGEIQGTMGNAFSNLDSTDWLATGKCAFCFSTAAKTPRVAGRHTFPRPRADRRKTTDARGPRCARGNSKPYFAPPGIPQERLNILRRAFDATLAAPGLLAEVAREQMAIKDPINGEQLTEVVDKIAKTPPATVQRLVSLFKNYEDSK
jgi:tripartite-type tricarboxylate transporter receptor subunit TctC